MYSTACSEPNKISASGVRMSHRSLFRFQVPLKHIREIPFIFTIEIAEKEYIKWEKKKRYLLHLVSVDKSLQLAPGIIVVVECVVGAGRKKSQVTFTVY